MIISVRPRDGASGENRDLLDGIGSATDSLARGLKDGVSGLYKNPMRGAERDGFAGFAKGVGTGVLGLVVKPVVGVTDAATDVLQGSCDGVCILYIYIYNMCVDFFFFCFFFSNVFCQCYFLVIFVSQ